MRPRKTLDNSISKTEWVNHFKEIYRLTLQDSENEQQVNESPLHINELDHEISTDEVRFAIRKLKTGKASENDDILAEMLKVGQEHFVKFLTTLFNYVFSSGIFPDIWTKSVIVPIHKRVMFIVLIIIEVFRC